MGQTDVLSFAQDNRIAGREETMARRRYQKGSLLLRGKREKVWVGRWLADEIQEGVVKRVRKSEVLGKVKELPTRKLALRELDNRLSSINSRTYKPAHVTTFRVLAEKWKTLLLPTHKPSSQPTERAHITRLSEFFGDMDAREITGEAVQRFVCESSSFRPKTVRNMVGTFRMIWKMAYDYGYVTRDERSVLRSVRMPEPDQNEQPCLTPEQSRQIIVAAEEPFRTMFWLVAETGIRGGEVCGLFVDDLDLENHVIHVRRSAWQGKLQTPKTRNAVRDFPISENLSSHLRQYLASGWRKNDLCLLFPTTTLGAYDNRDIVKWQMHPIMDRLGIPRRKGMGLHALRHGSATLLDQMDAPIAVRRERLGHSNFNTTMRYTHARSEDHRRIAAKLGRVFDPSCPTFVGTVVSSAS